jgi:predicted dehydrogenase
MRVALAGIGHWHAPMHADAVRHAGATIAGVWDPSPAITSGFARQHEAPAFPSLAALLATRPDLVVVMGHPLQAPETARAVLAANLPMLLEKPAAADTATLAALAPTGFVAVPLANRTSPIWAEHARLGGTPLHAHFRIVNGLPARYRADAVPWMLDPAIAGGGALRNLGLHAADAALSLFGPSPVTIATAQFRHFHGEPVEDYALATLTTPGGPVVIIEAGYTVPTMAPGGDFSWRLATSAAFLHDDGTTSLAITPSATTTLPPLPQSARYRAFMADTLTRLRQGKPPMVTFADYLAAMRLVDAITTAAAP